MPIVVLPSSPDVVRSGPLSVVLYEQSHTTARGRLDGGSYIRTAVDGPELAASCVTDLDGATLEVGLTDRSRSTDGGLRCEKDRQGSEKRDGEDGAEEGEEHSGRDSVDASDLTMTV